MPTKTMRKPVTRTTVNKTNVNRTTKPVTRRTYNNSAIVSGGKELATAGRKAVSGVAKILTPVRKAAFGAGETALNTVANSLNIGEETKEYKLFKLRQKEERELKFIKKHQESLAETRSQIRKLS